jgi:vacuolar protein sorting-associated protein 35
MKRAMDGDSLKLTLDHATEMLRELRTGLLSPKNYYELYMKIQDEMRELEEYLSQLHRSGRSLVEIYEQVQTCANVVPRLYLLCCVGGVYITSKEAAAKDILKDLIEMIKGVQHPMRGLFLRYYLTTISKNRLPDTGSVYEGIGGNINDALSFLLQNFVETNRLWVRLQTQSTGNKDKKKREKERQDLRILVGTNLVRLSQLEGLDIRNYRENVLPKILEEVVSCKDTMAQTYLMECVIQVFPDDFHLVTLDLFLKTIVDLKEKVNVRSILEAMMDRLANHANGNAQSIPAEIPAFKLFNECITTLIEDRSNMSLPETLRLQTALTNFALKCYPQHMNYVAHCLGISGALIAKTDFVNQAANNSSDAKSEDETTIQIEALLSAPLSSLALKVLDIPSYSKLMSYLPWGNWKEVAISLLKSVIAMNSPLSEVNQVEQLFKMIVPLLKDRDGSAPTENEEENERTVVIPQAYKEEQHFVARIPHLMNNEDTDVILKLLVLARTNFTVGGTRRMQFTFPSLIFAALNLARKVTQRERQVAEGTATAPQFSSRKVFHFVIEAITSLATPHPEVAMRLFLQATQAADECGLSAIAYEFAKEALLIYECEITDSRAQIGALTGFIGAFLNCRNFAIEDYEALITKIAQYSNKLLKKPDQSKMISVCSLLFYPPKNPDGTERYNDSDRVLECMQRALKIASVSNPNLYVDMLERYLYYYENDSPSITVNYISALIKLINETFASDPSTILPATQAHYRNTLGKFYYLLFSYLDLQSNFLFLFQ